MILGSGARRLASLLVVAAGVFVACGSEKAATDTGGVVELSCSSTAECQPGTYCGSDGTCRADCGPALPCAGGMLCAADGRCVSNGPGSGGTTAGVPLPGVGANPGIPTGMSGAGGGGGSGGGCAFSQAEFKQETPNVMLVVDRSLSMDEDFGTDSRWNVLRDALINPTDGFVTTLETQVRFGLTMYTSPANLGGPGGPGGGGRGGFPPPMGGGGSGGMASGGGGAGGTGAAECPILVQVPIALNNFQQISTTYAATEPLGFTPTGQSLALISQQIQALDPVTFPGPRVMVLATDGEPNSCQPSGFGGPDPAGRTASEEAIQAAYEAGIPTFVISVGNAVGEDHLRRIANLGQGFPVNDDTDRFYPANDPSELAAAFETIINGVRACVFDLQGTVDRNSASQGTVSVDGMPLTYMDPNGWHLNGNGQVVIDGEGCQRIQTGAQGVDIWFPCGVFVPE